MLTAEAVQHPEAIHAAHYYQGLAAQNKTLNRTYHEGVTIEQKVNGFRIGVHDFMTLEQAIAFIDRKKAFRELHGHPYMAPYDLSLWVENCLVYKCEPGKCKEMAAKVSVLIEKLGLPLHAEATTYHTQDSIVITFKSKA